MKKHVMVVAIQPAADLILEMDEFVIELGIASVLVIAAWAIHGNYSANAIEFPPVAGCNSATTRTTHLFGIGFNDYPEHVQLQQGWLFAEKAIDASCGLDIGGRVDFIYGTDGQDLQAFGNWDEAFDNDWDNGNYYGSALPQLYMEVGYGDLSVKIGRMLTNFGYESVMAPNNFFYSHSYAFALAQPYTGYTGTGAVATYRGLDNITITAGYMEGLNTGFDANGDTLVAGVGLDLTDRLDVQYNVVAGRFAKRLRWTICDEGCCPHARRRFRR